MTPLAHYQADLTRQGFQHDPAQEMAVTLLDDLYHRLIAREQLGDKKKGLFSFLKSEEPPEPEMGLYFWGGVGRGKTYLMDLFFDCLPFERKMRAHFHRFMQRVHRDLTALEGQKNPLEKIADNIADETLIICFDEFFVSDITDAMILGSLFEALFERGVSLVATSNIIPDNLYANGLQRQRFLPAIAMLNRYTQVVNVDGGTDYRLRALEQAELYHFPLDAGADVSLKQSLDSLAPEVPVENTSVEILGRDIPVKYSADDVAWFTFEALCDGPRSQTDYIELARIYHAVIVSGVPQMGLHNDDQARRFINMIDEFYDRSVKVVMSSDVALQNLYIDGKLTFEFERTQSRLLEMQSHEYLSQEHRP